MAKILLVEDDKSLREIYGVRLLAEGYDIVSAGDGEEALAMAIKERPHLIVSDVMMPKISGFDMLDILRSTTETKEIKVIMMTALSSEDQRIRGQQLGADRYLVKSQVGIEDVVRTVHEVLGDAPIANVSAANAFGPTTPSAVPRPAPVGVPQRQDAPQAQVPQPQALAPQPQESPAQVSQVSPAATPVVNPVQSMPAPTPAATVASPAPQAQPAAPTLGETQLPDPHTSVNESPIAAPSSGLPQPTAPFSTPRPAGLADRIIQPIERPQESGEPLDQLIAKELDSSPKPSEAITLVNPPVIPAPAPPTPPPVAQPVQPTPPNDEHGISFEETPRPSGPQPA